MQINSELIQKFFENKCSLSEKNAVIEYFKKYPEQAAHFFDKEEWDNISDFKQLPKKVSKPLYKKIKAKLFASSGNKMSTIKNIGRLSAVAATLILIIAVVLFTKKQPAHEVAIQNVGERNQTEKFVADSFIYHTNNTDKPIAFNLIDGTDVILQPHASIKLTQAYNINKRDVYLKGEGTFIVAKNQAKPFTVKTNYLNTTALGTKFKVSEKAGAVQVHLYEGKVVVRAAQQLAGWKDDVYLSPDEQLSYSANSALVTVKKIDVNQTINTAVQNNNVENLSFNNASLSKVIKQLSLKYNCIIQYKKEDVKGMNFTGTISKNDSLQVVLKLIANINGLSVEQKGNGFIISRP